MPEELESEVIATFKDGTLTRNEYANIMKDIRKNENYMDIKTYKGLVRLTQAQGLRAITKLEYVQCQEVAIFRATGVTRD